jgi:hypothetical protein
MSPVLMEVEKYLLMLEVIMDDSKSDREDIAISQSWLRTFHIFTITLVTLFGAFSSWQSQQINQKVQQLEQKYEHSREFSTQVLDSIEILSQTQTEAEKRKASMALIGLYSLTEADQDKKRLLVYLAAASREPTLFQTLDSIFQEDEKAREIAKSPGIRPLLLAFANENERDTTSTESKQPSADIDNQPNRNTAILQYVTTEKQDGMMYLGKVRSGNNMLEDRGIETQTIPKTGDEVIMTRNTHLREDILGEILGVVSKNSKVKILDNAKQVPIGNTGYNAVWVSVEILSQNLSR